MMGMALAGRIIEHRKSLGLTQDQFGRKYDVSGPAIFKFEKGYVNPSLGLWLKITRDIGLSDRRAVLIWTAAKLPEPYRKYVDPDTPEPPDESDVARHGLDYTMFDDRDAMRHAVLQDDAIPFGLKSLLGDDEIWALCKPTGKEIDFLRDTFGHLGTGSQDDFREALRVTRAFIEPA